MIDWWTRRIDRVDLAVRRDDGSMIWHHGIALTDRILAWARAENVLRRGDVYVRPARGVAWAMVMLDDVAPEIARKIARRYAALVVRTSPVGGCHVWLACARALDEHERRDAQRWLADRVAADRASTSGEHLGRLAGFRNWKRQGAWVNVEHASFDAPPWDPRPALVDPAPDGSDGRASNRHPPIRVDRSASGREWGWVCGMLEAGCPARRVYEQLVVAATRRGRRDAARYARRTVDHARAQMSRHGR